jgi:hypothetical protein
MRIRKASGLAAGVFAVAGVLGSLEGCGIGAYSKDPRAGRVVDEVVRGVWDYEVSRVQGSGERGRNEVNQRIIVQGNGYQPPPKNYGLNFPPFSDVDMRKFFPDKREHPPN